MKTHLQFAVIFRNISQKEEQREFGDSAKNKNRETEAEEKQKEKAK